MTYRDNAENHDPTPRLSAISPHRSEDSSEFTRRNAQACQKAGRNYSSILITTVAAGLVFSAIASCRESTEHGEPALIVYAAASTADVVISAGKQFTRATGIEVQVSNGPSGTLANQIASGAPCDIFVSAHPKYISALSKNEAPANSTVDLATNELVWVCPQVSVLKLNLESALQSATRIAIANPDHAPAGEYAKASLQHAGQWGHLQPKMIFANDARMTAQYVADGLVDLAIIYRNDAAAFGNRITILEPVALPPSMTIRYQGIAIDNGSSAAANKFLTYLASAEASDIWKDEGFVPLASSR